MRGAEGDEMDEGCSGVGLYKGPDHGSAYMLGASRVGCWVRVGGLVVVMARGWNNICDKTLSE